MRDLHKAYPDQFEIGVDTHFTNVWWNNPYITKFENPGQAQLIEISWANAIHWNSVARYGDERVRKHILAWYHYDFEMKTGMKVPVTDPKADLHLTDEEKRRRISGNYWIILSGGKLDMTTKHWHAHRAQEVVDKLLERGIRCVQVGGVHSNHVHPPLKNTVNMIGKTDNERDLFNLIMHADGVICGVTGAMHIAAAFDKPCVVYAGGREEPWFEAYVNEYKAFGPEANPVKVEHKFLHTIGQLECCDKQGCWKKRVLPLDPQDMTKNVHTLCRKPLRPENSHAVASCQDLITSDQIVEAVLSYQSPVQIPELKPTGGIEIPTAPLQIIREPSKPDRPQKPYQQVHPLELKRDMVRPLGQSLHFMDDPIIGGKITVFVLCYGNYPQLAHKCFNGILKTIPAERLDLRVAANEVSSATLAYLKQLPITKLYEYKPQKFKYPAMREMFWDESCPITTNYIVWFDDDTWVATPNWLNDLCQTIIGNHHYGFRMYGNLMYHDIANYAKNGNRPELWFRSASWYNGLAFRARGGMAETPNGSCIDFAVGWCWALETAAMRQAGIPDVRLQHNGGDICIGEQIHQAGFRIKQWNRGKSLIACPTREAGGRRGFSQRFPWDAEQ